MPVESLIRIDGNDRELLLVERPENSVGNPEGNKRPHPRAFGVGYVLGGEQLNKESYGPDADGAYHPRGEVACSHPAHHDQQECYESYTRQNTG